MPSVSSVLTLTVNPSSSLSPDGSKIIGQPNGGGDGTLTTAYGTITFGDKKAPPDGTHAGTFCIPLLNGIEMNPAGPCGAFGFPAVMQLWIKNGGCLYGVGNDQIWLQWSGYKWNDNFGAPPNFDFLSGPGLDPPPQPLPTYNPPYTPYADGSSISGGTGSLTTADGIWTFGTAGNGGWRGRLNGIELQRGATTEFFPYDRMTVSSHGQMFLHRSDTQAWEFWAMHQCNPSTGPTAGPVPINLSISPSRPAIPSGSPPDTFVADLSVVMSDSSPFSGIFNLVTNSELAPFKIVGSKIFVNTTPPNNFYINNLSALQNGATLRTIAAFGVPT